VNERIARERERLRTALRARANRRRLWGAVGTGLLPPPPSAFGSFGRTSFIVPPARVQSPEHIFIGERIEIGEGVWFCVVPQEGRPPPRLVIGDETRVSRFVKIVCAGEVVIKEECGISDHTFIADTHYRWDDPSLPIIRQPLAEPRPVIIGARSFIGFRAVIKPGVTIGDNAYIGAGAVIDEDVPPRTVVVGDPGRAVRRYDDATGSWEWIGREGPA
jgi:acetyltransferase-like isoleucine patch superfamily enzyme